MFYNTSADAPNCVMFRYFDQDRFECYAIRPIKKGEELTHRYRSLMWRKAFVDSDLATVATHGDFADDDAATPVKKRMTDVAEASPEKEGESEK